MIETFTDANANVRMVRVVHTMIGMVKNWDFGWVSLAIHTKITEVIASNASSLLSITISNKE